MAYSWLTVHRVQFREPRCSRLSGAPSGPMGAGAWRFGPHAPIGADGFRTTLSDIWGGVGFYHDRSAAEAVVSDPKAHFPWLHEALEHWHALAGVVAYRGEADWSTNTEPNPEIVPLETDPGGRIAVITSAGYDLPNPKEDPRLPAFLKGIEEVVAFYRTLEENLAATLFNAVEAKQGLTFSIWKTDEGMMASAYKSGLHSKYLRQHQSDPMFDRSSFMRLRLLDSSGSWEGVNPAVG